MRWHPHILLVLVLTAVASTSSAPVLVPPAEARPVREINAGRISALVPSRWDFRPMPSSSAAAQGIQASRDLRRWSSPEHRELGLEAYWIDAARVGLPSDYYYLAAEGPAMKRLPDGRACSQERLDVLANRRPLFDRTRYSAGDYVATAGGTCSTRGRVMRWASFIAAPGYGPVGRIGIPQSGLYFALVMVPEGPTANDRAEELLSSVSFGGTEVREFLSVAAGPVR